MTRGRERGRKREEEGLCSSAGVWRRNTWTPAKSLSRLQRILQLWIRPWKNLISSRCWEREETSPFQEETRENFRDRVLVFSCCRGITSPTVGSPSKTRTEVEGAESRCSSQPTHWRTQGGEDSPSLLLPLHSLLLTVIPVWLFSVLPVWLILFSISVASVRIWKYVKVQKPLEESQSFC